MVIIDSLVRWKMQKIAGGMQHRLPFLKEKDKRMSYAAIKPVCTSKPLFHRKKRKPQKMP
jgi:hypothetical protein